MAGSGFSFPFQIDAEGRVALQSDDENTRVQVLQLLLTAPGERVMLPEFGSGLKNLVFDPNNDILAAATEYTVQRALQRWLGAQVIAEGVGVRSEGETLTASVVYTTRRRAQRAALKITF